MGDWLSYTFESGVAMVLMYMAYKWLLAGTTFYRMNRALILMIIAASWVIPAAVGLLKISGAPEIEIGAPIPVNVVAETVTSGSSAASGFGWKEWLCVAYIAGAAGVSVFVAYGTAKMMRTIRRGRHERCGKYTLVISASAYAPFSWGRYIVIRPQDCDKHKEMIIAHEASHLKHYHWVDLLIAQVNVILQWYNPEAWLLKSELKAVHEYQADAAAGAENMKKYQLMLLKKAVGSSFPTLADSLNHSQLKTRLTMMLKPKSKSARRLAVLTLPAVAVAAVFTLSMPMVADALAEIRTARIPGISISEGKGNKSDAPVQIAGANELTDADSATAVTQQGDASELPLTTSANLFDNAEKEADEKAPAYFVNDEPLKGDINSISPDQIESMTIVKNDPAYPEGKIMIFLKGYKKLLGETSNSYAAPAKLAEFKGGQKAMMEFLSENIQWPEGVTVEKPERVIVQFTVGKDGSVSDPEIKRGRNPKLDQEALRVVKLMNGHWIPATNEEGEAIATSFVLPVNFKPESGENKD